MYTIVTYWCNAYLHYYDTFLIKGVENANSKLSGNKTAQASQKAVFFQVSRHCILALHYQLTFQVSRYWLLALKSSVVFVYPLYSPGGASSVIVV